MDHDGKWKSFVSPAVRRARKHGVTPHYTLQAGRLIVRDGVPLATLHGAKAGYDPVEVDELVVQIVKLLNE